MKLVTFLYQSEQKIGAVIGEEIVDFSSSDLPQNMIEFISLGNEGLERATSLIEKGENKLSISDVKLMAPIPKPNKTPIKCSFVETLTPNSFSIVVFKEVFVTFIKFG